MRKSTKRILSWMLVVLTVLSVIVIVPSQKAEAATFTPAKSYYLDVTANNKKYGVSIQEVLNNFSLKVTNVKSYDTTVLKVKKENGYIYLRPLKTGSARITVSYKENGTTKTFTRTVKTRTYANPLKKFTVGSVSFTSRFKSDNYCQYNSRTEQTVKGKLNVVAASGWEIVKIQKYDYFKSKWTTLKNGNSYTFKCNSDRLVVTLKHTSSGFKRKCTVGELG